MNRVLQGVKVNKASRIARWGADMVLPMLCAGMLTAQSAGNWTLQMPSNSPSSKGNPAMAYDSAHGQIVFFGGAPAFNYTWIWDGFNWTQPASLIPPGRGGNAMAYDAAHGQVVMFGGYLGGNYLSDTWVWDGFNWSQKSPQTSPIGRAGHAMAYDSGHRQIVMFGGSTTPSTLSNETWIWDGFNWTQKSPQTSPSVRVGHAMAYDSAHGQIVMFGGYAGLDMGDTWIWDGSNWAQKSPKSSPTERSYYGMAYDSAHSQVVLFGGHEVGYNGETWVWDGSNWVQESPKNTPGPQDAIMADYAHGQVVLFGGGGTTWVWDGGAGGTPTIGGVVSASAYGGFASVAPGSWVEIYGSNLAPDTRQWAGSDFTGVNAPTMLDGVQVSIGGQKAFLDYISSGQVNAQLPSNIGTGPAQIILTSGNVNSAAFNITVNSTEPGLLAPPSFKIGGNQYVVAQFSDLTYVLPAGSIAGVTSRPAKPGETIIIYGVGFGSVTPNIPAGQIATQSNQLLMPLQVLFGQTPAQTPYFGLTPGFVGLYQFNVVVPAVPNNDLVPLTFNLGGVAGTQTLFIAVRQ
jgi:uncharacterized protein (TIGR03437 family)